jgi:hypothetical protein
VGNISSLSPDEIRRRISESNRQSASKKAKYVYWESRAVQSDYELMACLCEDDCWCVRNACAGHYRVKDITFEEFLESYLRLWIPPSSRQNVKGAVLKGLSFKGRQEGAIGPLRWLRPNWPCVLDKVRRYGKCGLCDSAAPPVVSARVSNLYEAKMWSQLFYDSIVPFDTKSKAEMRRAGYSDPAQDFLEMNRELFGDLRKLSDAHGLGVPGLRRLDSPGKVDPQLQEPAGGQPLSRVIDKIFYRP